MADTGGDKTLDPTQKKLDDARQKGDVPSAPEMRHAIALAAMLCGLLWLGESFAMGLMRLAAISWESAGELRIDPAGAQGFTSGLFGAFAGVLAPLLLLFLLAGVATAFSSGRPSFSWTRLAPKWSKISPFGGMKRIFGPQGLVEFLKTLAKCLAVLGLGWWALGPTLPAADGLVGMEPGAIALAVSALVMGMLKWLLILVAALALLDLAWQRFSFTKKQRMSHQEVRDEYKESDGDPMVKARQRQIGLQRSRQRMVAAVPTASVIITNPTHYAVALRYEHGAMRAPIVVAKGTDRIALRIRELATEAGVPLVENRPLARALYASAEIDRPIPVEQYAAVAEVISFVLRQAGKAR